MKTITSNKTRYSEQSLELIKLSLVKNGMIKYSQKTEEALRSFQSLFIEATKDYKDPEKWYEEKVLKGIYNGTREVALAVVNGEIAGFVIMKNEEKEKKLCTLYVKEMYKTKTYLYEGKDWTCVPDVLFKEIYRFLGTTKPLVTIPDYKIESFGPIIKKYGWKETKRLEEGYYKEGIVEVVFNKR